jgi:hypothetical protein
MPKYARRWRCCDRSGEQIEAAYARWQELESRR